MLVLSATLSDLNQYQIRKKLLKNRDFFKDGWGGGGGRGIDRSSIKNINAKWQKPVPYGSSLDIPRTHFHLLAAQQEGYIKANL